MAAANANVNAARHHARVVESVRQDFAEDPPAPVCGPVMFGVGAQAAFALSLLVHATMYVVFGTPPGSAVRVFATVVGSTAGMLSYAHVAGDLVTQKAVAAVALAQLAGSLVVLYLEQCCRPGQDWLLMGLLPNAIAVVVYTGLRDLGVLMHIQYGRGDRATQDHYRRRSFMSNQEKLDEEIALLERELHV